MRQVILYPGENGFWVAECPSLPGCQSGSYERRRGQEHPRSHRRLHPGASGRRYRSASWPFRCCSARSM